MDNNLVHDTVLAEMKLFNTPQDAQNFLDLLVDIGYEATEVIGVAESRHKYARRTYDELPMVGTYRYDCGLWHDEEGDMRHGFENALYIRTKEQLKTFIDRANGLVDYLENKDEDQ